MSIMYEAVSGCNKNTTKHTTFKIKSNTHYSLYVFVKNTWRPIGFLQQLAAWVSAWRPADQDDSQIDTQTESEMEKEIQREEPRDAEGTRQSVRTIAHGKHTSTPQCWQTDSHRRLAGSAVQGIVMQTGFSHLTSQKQHCQRGYVPNIRQKEDI